ncbi:hypothetical protein BDV25DRAFT_141030 [Aspergillus avenaceus]|uniref:Uncharacterized protein n=1 Tax=Aspergillus avenaceus TaxID=36643 RepID=A0A5N6TT13_ASPAV|nr:hypothetical protein BDV25DRAFT_141030 [Aspergillus avenaceus]
MLPPHPKTIEMIDDGKEVAAEDHVDILNRLGTLHYDEKNFELELQYNKAAFDKNTNDINTRYALFKTYHRHQKAEEARNILEEASKYPIDGTATQLKRLIQKAAEDKERPLYILYGMATLCASESGTLNSMLKDTDTAIEEARMARSYRTLAPFLLHKGVTIRYFCVNEPDSHGSAFEIWKECKLEIEKNIHEADDKTFYLEQVNRQLSLYYFEQLETGEMRTEEHIAELEQITQSHTGLSPAKMYLAAYFRSHNRPDKARDLLKPHMSLAFDLLSDEATADDAEAYSILHDILITYGEIVFE